MEILETKDNTADKKFDYMLRKLLSSPYLEPQVSSRHIVHDEIEVVSILKSIDHVDQERMLELAEKPSLVHD